MRLRPLRRAPQLLSAAPWRAFNTTPSYRKALSAGSNVKKVQIAPNNIDVNAFRRLAFTPETPLVLAGAGQLPAIKCWFLKHENGMQTSFTDYLYNFKLEKIRYEIVMNPSNRKSLDEFQRWLYTPHKDPDIWLFSNEGAPFANAYEQLCLLTKPPLCYSEFATFYAQLGLLLKAAEYNRYQENSDLRIKELYIAQFPLEDLPLFLKKDLITPEIVKRAGKGDIYNTSIWLGLEPTFTPLHRDPNPNLFVQMASTKRVRLLPPARGKDLYTRVRNEIGGGGNPNIRGEEMMSGNERDALHKAVWGPQAPDDIQEAVLGPSDCLFIPNGWWHSVRSGSEDGGLNASVNWWFR